VPRVAAGSSIYPAAQNMLLAARALGLGGIELGDPENRDRRVPERKTLAGRNRRAAGRQESDGHGAGVSGGSGFDQRRGAGPPQKTRCRPAGAVDPLGVDSCCVGVVLGPGQAGLLWGVSTWDRSATAERLITEGRLPAPGDHERGTIKKLGSSQKGPGKIGPIEHRFESVRAVQMRTRQIRPAQVRAPEIGPPEIAATLIQDLLTFARRKPLYPTVVDVCAVIYDAEKILKQTIGPSVQVAFRTAPDLWPAWVDPNQLGLAILNLALNDRDAMPAGGSLRVACENRRAGAGHAPEDLVDGDYVIVSVSDTGTGMSEATLAHAIEPFFTTKEAGRGSGLGLSMVQGFAAQSGGAVRISSSLGKGTTVEIWLPRAEGELTASVSAEPGELVIEQRRARILVCDDDVDVCSLVSTLLRELGHTVWEAPNPVLALQILERERPLDLLLVDYAMPEMNGRDVIDRARRYQPSLKMLLMTGYAEALHNNGMSGIPILPKPFKAAELSRRIAEILDELSSNDTVRGRETLH
jgi:CheY-like chemotaxis protein